ncbi:hypothetical protein GCM10025879_06080 [Leuconostoc litchii]|uniref:MucBP domain-containing protein n=1 Tax=Leuconostoc litchii TaxID=1981069 RepID=A0A6P2CSW2_9LACO|nr:MucBP domain-containing protein [Leuconostoc litchii]TYC47357.1 hypothetical protein ESZ47_04245 [Leuconostoc litchii]GMA69362.1 hypothetical protein GCM10025879_06080 [Leuconostoc litchii]
MANISPVWVYYKSIATNDDLCEPKRIDGKTGTSYDINPTSINDYQYIDSSEELSGRFESKPKTIKLYYRPQTWQAVHRINMYIETLTDVHIFQTPDEHLSENVGYLNSNTFWATHVRAITGNGQFWYQVGYKHWIRYDATQIKLSDVAPEIENINYFDDAEKNKSTQPNAVVNFLPDQFLEVYAEPYGLPIGSTSDGDFVTIIKEIHDDNEIVWYRLANKGWINSIYIDKL